MARRLPRLPEWGTANRLSWRVTLVQFLANAIVLGLVIGLLPGFELHARHPFIAILWLAVVLGVLTALARPLLEFVLLPYLLQSLGLVVIVIDAALLALLGLTSTLEIDGFWALVAGAVLAGVLGFVLDGLLGLTPPVVDDATVRAERGERLVRIGAISERLRLMQLYGLLLQYVVDIAFDLAPLRPVRRPLQRWLWRPTAPIATLPLQVKVRLLLQDLGPTFVKLGQIVSSQGRMLPLEWEHELARLQSDVRPFAYEDVRTIVGESLGAPPETLYESFNPVPLAAASLAQVHDATTHDGRRVAVKVQRPNIHEQLHSDIRILTRGASWLERRLAWARDGDLKGMVREFGSTLVRELDYSIEAYNARRLERVLAPIDGGARPRGRHDALLEPRADARVHRGREVDRHGGDRCSRARPSGAGQEPRPRRGADGDDRGLLPCRPASGQRRRRARDRPPDVSRHRHGGRARAPQADQLRELPARVPGQGRRGAGHARSGR